MDLVTILKHGKVQDNSLLAEENWIGFNNDEIVYFEELNEITEQPWDVIIPK